MDRNRKMRVILNGYTADWVEVLSGVLKAQFLPTSWSAIVPNLYKKAVLSQGNRAMPQMLFLV